MLASVTEETAGVATEHLFALAAAASAFRCVELHLFVGFFRFGGCTVRKPLPQERRLLSAGQTMGEAGEGRATIPTLARVMLGTLSQPARPAPINHGGLKARGVPGAPRGAEASVATHRAPLPPGKPRALPYVLKASPSQQGQTDALDSEGVR